MLRRVIFLLCILFFTLLFTSCFDLCDNEIISTIPSPDNQHVAVIFNRGCGATVGDILSV